MWALSGSYLTRIPQIMNRALIIAEIKCHDPRLRPKAWGSGTGMPLQRKIFRIQEVGNSKQPAASAIDADAALRHYEIMSELKALRTVIDPNGAPPSATPTPVPSDIDIPAHVEQLKQVRNLKSELDLIHAAINRTKQEIATLHITGFQGPEMSRVTNELDAVVAGTENATQNILKAAEDIDQAANALSNSLKTEYEQGVASDIQDHVVKIFEACNFQDLTGQRITKVVMTLKFIETHIVRMMEIWGGIEAFKDYEPTARAERNGDASLLNGPKLEDDPGHASQDDIDALFG
jgi:chemotaxis protein CheZ